MFILVQWPYLIIFVYYRPQRSWAKVISLHASVCPHGGGVPAPNFRGGSKFWGGVPAPNFGGGCLLQIFGGGV